MAIFYNGNLIWPDTKIGKCKCDGYINMINSIYDPESSFNNVIYNGFDKSRSKLMSKYKVYLNYRIYSDHLVVDVLLTDPNNEEKFTMCWIDVDFLSIILPTVNNNYLVISGDVVPYSSGFASYLTYDLPVFKIFFFALLSILGHLYMTTAFPKVDIKFDLLINEIKRTKLDYSISLLHALSKFCEDCTLQKLSQLIRISDDINTSEYYPINTTREKVVKFWREVWTFSCKYSPFFMCSDTKNVDVTITYSSELNKNACAPNASVIFRPTPQNVEEEVINYILVGTFSCFCKISTLMFLLPTKLDHPFYNITKKYFNLKEVAKSEKKGEIRKEKSGSEEAPQQEKIKMFIDRGLL